MRDYSKVSPAYWTGETGRTLRRLGPEAQLLGLYLITCQSSNMIGLYYLPLPTLCHETGIPLEGALKALLSLSEAHFAHYDEASEVVWIPEMASYQLGETLSEKDNRHKGVIKLAESYRKTRFYVDFYKRYRVPFHLPKPSPLQGASKPLRSQEQEQEQKKEQEQEQNTPLPPKGDGAGEVEVPVCLDTPDFLSAWSEWLAYRRDRRLSCRPRTLQKQLAFLAALGSASAAVFSVEQSIRNGWQGLFEPRGPAVNGRPAADLFGGIRDFLAGGESGDS